jgi:ribokinase
MLPLTSPPLVTTLVVGGLNTDLLGIGVPRLLGRGELVLGGTFQIKPGGKSRNIAQMIACLGREGRVAMVGRTARDLFGLWRPPLDALEQAGVDTRYIRVLTPEEAGGKMPGVALIPVERGGTNQIYVLPGVNEDFSVEDVEQAAPLFRVAGQNHGSLVLALECPLPTAVHAVRLGNQHRLRVLLDPGGIAAAEDCRPLLAEAPFLIKPNVSEAGILTGEIIRDFAGARDAARKLFAMGAQNVLITAGAQGAYFFGQGGVAEVLSIPEVPDTEASDETGCGDQTMAALCVALEEGDDLVRACRRALAAGTLQFHRAGVSPITRQEWDSLNLSQAAASRAK